MSEVTVLLLIRALIPLGQYYCEQPELRDYFAGGRREVWIGATLPFRHDRHSIVWDEATAQWHVTVQRPRGGPRRSMLRS